MNVGRDYIVEYQAGQFQHGSLVLRFPDDPSDMQIRAALVDHGLPAKALQEVRARPLGAGRSQPATWSAPEEPTEEPAPPQVPRSSTNASRRGGRRILIPVIIGLFGLGMMRAEPAIEIGREAGLTVVGDAWGHCTMLLDAERSRDDSGIIGSQFSTLPTAFLVSPANAAFMVACLGESVE